MRNLSFFLPPYSIAGFIVILGFACDLQFPLAGQAPDPAPRAAGLPQAKPAPTTQTPSPGRTASRAALAIGPRLSAVIARKELEKLCTLQMVFDAPAQTMVGVREKVVARVPETLAEDFTKGLKGLGVPNVEEIAAGSFIKVRLAGDGFDVKALSNDEQIVSSKDASWVWDITPLRSGVQPLLLNVTVRTKVPGGGYDKRDLSAFSRTVTVAASPVYSMARFVRIEWPWIIGVIVAAVGASGVVMRKTRASVRHR